MKSILLRPGAADTCIDIRYTLAHSVYLLHTHCGGNVRDAPINIRAQAGQRDLIDHAATALGKNRSDFMLEAACDRARAVLLDQAYFRVDAAAFRQFNKLLDQPAAANPGLDRLMAVVSPWQRKAGAKAKTR
jgi:uncharacterized protein (DUF1778 family)